MFLQGHDRLCEAERCPYPAATTEVLARHYTDGRMDVTYYTPPQ